MMHCSSVHCLCVQEFVFNVHSDWLQLSTIFNFFCYVLRLFYYWMGWSTTTSTSSIIASKTYFFTTTKIRRFCPPWRAKLLFISQEPLVLTEVSQPIDYYICYKTHHLCCILEVYLIIFLLSNFVSQLSVWHNRPKTVPLPFRVKSADWDLGSTESPFAHMATLLLEGLSWELCSTLLVRCGLTIFVGSGLSSKSLFFYWFSFL